MKNWYQSKTVWLNLATFLLMVAALFLPGSEFSDLLTPVVVKYISLGIAVLNIALRVWFTNQPIGEAKG